MSTTVLKVDVQATGMDPLVKSSGQVAGNFKEANSQATKLAGTVARQAKDTAAVKFAASGGGSVPNDRESNTARGIGGQTGASARDFAKQAQGLGGLVHVYATFAANIFAVSAAYTALSKAMDTANLVKGLDQIGASSGRNLGSLAKQMVSVADGAISLQQAMTSTAMAAAGGMTNQAILRMTEVAKKASLALGRDMPDSMDRLTKGIIKTQPELLDELGIMTRVIPAQQEYARQIGKTAASLTDFEKRQAFANAVLTEGERKFGAINLDANPYSKVLASMQNLMQSGLELINKVLGPLMSMLAASPTGLAVALGGIAAVLMKQAMPAIGMFRENAKRMADESAALANRRSNEARAASIKQVAEARAHAEKLANAELEASNQAISKLEKLRAESKIGKNTKSFAILEKTPQEVTDKDLEFLEKQAVKLDKRNAVAAKGFRDAAESIKVSRDLEAHAQAAIDSHIQALQKKSSYLSVIAQQQRIADKANQQASVRNIQNVWAENTQLEGFFKATKQGWAELKAARKDSVRFDPDTGLETNIKGISRLQLVTGGIAGTAKAAAAGMMTLAASLGNVFMVIGAVTAVFAVFDSLISNSVKEASAFESSLETLNSSFANVDKTLDLINKKDASEFLSVESTQAKANALNDLTGNLTAVVGKFEKLQASQNGWDSFFDGFWDMFGKGSGDKLAQGISGSVIDSLKLMREGPAKEEAKKSIAALFNTKVDFSSVKAFNASIKDLDKTEIASKGKAIEALLATASREANNAASAMTGFKTALADVGRQSTSMSNAILPKDEFSKMGMELAKASTQMAEALKDPINSLVVLGELAGDLKTLSFLPPGIASQLGGAKTEIDKLTSSIATLEKELSDSEEKRSKYRSDYDTANKSFNTDRTSQGFKELKESLVLEEQRNSKIKTRLKIEEDAAKQLKATYASIPDLLNKASMDLLTKGLTNALGEAAIAAAKGYLSVLNAAGIGTANEDAGLKQQEINLQMDLVKANYANAIAVEGLKVSTDALTLINERAILEGKLQDAKSIGEASELGKLLDNNIARFKDVVAKGNILSRSREENLKDFRNKNAEGTSLENKQAMEQMTTYMYALIGSEQQLAKLRAQSGAVELERRVKVIAEEVSHTKDLLDTEAKALNTKKENIDLAIQASSEYDSVLSKQKLDNDLAIINNSYLKEREDILGKIRTIQVAIDSAGSTDKTRRGMAEAKAKLEEAEKAKEAKDASTKQASIKTDIAGVEQLRAAKQASRDRELKETEAINTALISAREEELTYLNSIGAIDNAELAVQKSKLDLTKQQSAYALELANIESTALSNLSKLAGEYRLAQEAGSSSDKLQEIQARMAAEAASIERQSTALAINNNTKVKGIELTGVQTAMNVKQTDEMAKMQSITESLNTLFGDMGSNLGKAAEAFAKMGQEAEKFAATEKDRIALQSTIDDGVSSVEEKAAATKKLTTLENNYVKSQLTGTGAVAGAAKKLFGEKTAAYKVLDGMEKASAAMKLALEVKEMAMTLKNFAVKIGLIAAEETAEASGDSIRLARLAATEAAANTIKTPGIYASFMSAMGPWGIAAAGAAIATFVGSAFGGGGGSDFTMPKGVTSAERQETQGTGGVFGDTTAKSESIQKSLELIAETTVEGMSYDNQTVKLLTSINEGISKLAISMVNTVGISSGTGFGTVEATSGGSPGLLGGLFGSSSTDTSIIDSGIQLQGTFMDLVNAGTNANAVLNQFETVQTTTTKTGALFGLFGGGSSTSINENIKALDKDTREKIGGIFTNVYELFKEQGTKLGTVNTYVTDILTNFNVDKLASLRGLKGEELQKELSAVISSIMDDAAKELFPQLSKFKKFNEGYSQTVTRVLDTNDKINLSFKALGRPLGILVETTSQATSTMLDNVKVAEAELAKAKAAVAEASNKTQANLNATDGGPSTIASPIDTALIDNVTASELALAEARKTVEIANNSMTTNNLALTESLANAAGGLDKFLEISTKFSEAYLTEVERLKPTNQALISQMNKLGIVANTSKEEVKQLVLSYQVTDAASAQYYVDLLKLADAYETNRTAMLELANSYGIGADAIKKILDGAIDAANDSSNVGYNISNEIIYSIQSAMYEQASTAISNMMFDTVISPMINSLMAGTFAADILSGSFDEMVDKAVALTEGIAAVFSNPEMLEAIDIIGEKLGKALGTAAAVVIRSPTLSGGSSGGRPSTSSSSSSSGSAVANQPQVMSAEDLRKALLAQEIELLNAQNRSYEALQLTRAEELNLLNKEVADGTKTIAQVTQLIAGKQAIYAAQDAAKTYQLSINLLTAQGKSYEALIKTREKELLSLSNTDKAIQQLIYSAEDFARTVGLQVTLMGLIGMSSEALALTRQKELAALSDTDKAIQQQIYLVQDAQSATDKAYAALERAVAAQRKSISKAIEDQEKVKQTASDLVDSIQSVFDYLKSQVEDLYGTVASTTMMSASQGEAFITEALIKAQNSGTLPVLEDLTKAVTSVRKGYDITAYSTSFEEKKNQLILAGKLEALKTVSQGSLTSAKTQLSVATESLSVLSEQLTALDSILEEQKTLIDVMRGVNTSVLSIPSAITALASAIASETSTSGSAGGSVNRFAGLSTIGAQLLVLREAASNKGATLTNTEMVTALKAANIPGGPGLNTDGTAPFGEVSSLSIRGFASGGDHMGGLRIVGEDGPELENTGPSRIFNARQTANMLNNNETTEEIKKLRKQLNEQNEYIVYINERMVKIFDRWDLNGMPEVRAA